jgi:hypothetical protein
LRGTGYEEDGRDEGHGPPLLAASWILYRELPRIVQGDRELGT